MSAAGKVLGSRGELRAYIGMFRMKLIAGVQYRAAAWAGVATQFFWGFMLLMIYNAFYTSSTVDPGMEFSQLVAYTWLHQAFLALVMMYFQDNDLFESITTGTVAYELCRPLSLYWFWYARQLGSKLVNVAMRMVPILAIAFFLPEPYRLTLPPDLSAFFAFLLSIGLSALLVVALSMFIYVLTMLTLSASGPRLFIGLTVQFLSGSLLPLPLMPLEFQRVLDWLPFRYTVDLPFRIYSGNIAGAAAVQGIGVQAIWIVLLIALGYIAFQSALKRTVIQGG